MSAILEGLQRGRGDSARQLPQLERDQAIEMLISCITNDPRVDTQVESRDLYYARSMADLGAPASLLEGHLFSSAPVEREEFDHRDGLSLSALGVMARMGDAHAVAMLRRYVEVGYDYERALEELADLEDDSVFDGLADAAIARFVEDDGFIPFDEDRPWTLWKDHPFVVKEYRRRTEVRQTQQQERNERADWTAAQFLAEAEEYPAWSHAIGRTLARLPNVERSVLVNAAQADGTGSRCAALVALACLGDNVVLEIAPPLLQNEGPDEFDRLRRGAWQAMHKMKTPETLNWARMQHTSDIESSITAITGHILATQGESGDAERILDLVNRSTIDADHVDYTLCDLVDATCRLRLVQAGATLHKIYSETRYSYLRAQCVDAIEACGVSNDELRADWLWDCEAGTRLVGIENSPASSLVNERLKRMASEAVEESEVCSAAVARIKSGAGGSGSGSIDE